MMRQDWIDLKDDDLAITRQCELAGVSRATIYAQQRPTVPDEEDLLLRRLIDKEYTRHPFFGSRRMVIIINQALGRRINRKRIQRLMQDMGLQGMAPGPNTSRVHPQHPVYPTCCAAWKSLDPTRSGAPTSPTSAWPKGLFTW